MQIDQYSIRNTYLKKEKHNDLHSPQILSIFNYRSKSYKILDNY